MIRVYVAQTCEIDDIETAIEDVRRQIDMPACLLAHSVGIIACHYEYVYSGVAKALCEAMPFDVVGTITTVQAINEASGTLMLTLMVLTSDDIRLQTVLTPSLERTPGAVIERAYRDAVAESGAKPSLILSFAPFMVQNSGDEYVSVITRASGGVPCFGTLSVDDTSDFSNCFMLHNGEHYRDRMAMILLDGALDPRFFIATISRSKIIDKPALITSSEGHLLKEVNGRPVVEYFEDLGLTHASETSYAMTSLPFMLDYNDGTPQVSKVFIGLNENRHAICAGAMPEGSTLRLGVFDRDDVLQTTREVVRAAFAEKSGASGMLIYSCVSRTMTLGSELLAELDLVRGETGDSLPFMMAYSGGEICPTQLGQGNAINRFHNNAFILCIF